MILAKHAVAGAALASLTPDNPAIGFITGFLSHFVLDAIPHWDYDLESETEDKNDEMNNEILINKKFLKDIFKKIGPDIAAGCLISYLIFCLYFKISIIAVLCGAAGGIVPDALQLVYMKWKHEPLKSLRRFHIWIHAPKRAR